jgi:HEPN domain
MGHEEVEALIGRGVVRRVEADSESAQKELAAARRHLESVSEIAEIDPDGAFSLAYDAARKAIAAHMRAKGFRPGQGKGAHAKTGQYAVAALDNLGIEDHLDSFESMRSVRNRSEYDAQLLESADALEALEHARVILDAVERDLG